MPRVYLETSFISACINDGIDAASVYRRERSLEWWKKCRSRHMICTSAQTLRELGHSPEALDLLENVPVLTNDSEAAGFARLLVTERVMPDAGACHLAIATVHKLEYMLSWNVRQLGAPSTLEHLQHICLRLSLVPPRITIPDFLWDDSIEPGPDPLIDEIRTIRARLWSATGNDPSRARSN